MTNFGGAGSRPFTFTTFFGLRELAFFAIYGVGANVLVEPSCCVCVNERLLSGTAFFCPPLTSEGGSDP